MSKSRKRIAEEEDEDEEDLWSEEEEETAKKPKKRTKQSFIDDVVGDDDDGGGGGGGGGGAGGLDELDDGYDSEMYGDEADRTYLDSLPELQREIILDERRSKRKEMQERRDALSKAAGRSNAVPATRGSTRSAAAKRGAALPYSAIEDLIARRTKANATKQSESLVFGDDEDGDEEMAVEDDEEDDDRRSKRRQRSTQRRDKKRESVMEAAEDDDDEQAVEVEGEVDAEAAEEKARQREEARFSIPGSHTPLRLSDMKMLQLRRERLERIYEEPWFADVVKGMFVRVGVGPDSKGVAKYRVGEVVRCEEMKTKYPFPTGSVNRTTRLGLVLRYGELERTWSMAAISNQSITDDEFTDWTRKMKKSNLPTPTAEEALERKKRAEYSKETYVYTPEQVARMVAEKRGRGKQINITIERTEMEMDLARAKAVVEGIRIRSKARGRREQKEEDDEEDEDERRRADERQLEEEERRIEQIENKLSELREVELKQQKTAKARPEMTNILNVNKRNAEKDILTMRDMFIQHEREKREEEEQLKREGKTRTIVLDPFKRKATRPQTQFEAAEEEAKQDAQKDDEKKDDTTSKEEQARLDDRQRLEDAARRRLVDVTHIGELTRRDSVGSGPLAFPKPPSLSDQLLAQLVLEHRASKDVVDVSKQGGGVGLLGAAGRWEGGGRVADSKYTHLPAGERVLTVGEYWRRREQA